jgi:hypothetical protein
MMTNAEAMSLDLHRESQHMVGTPYRSNPVHHP